MIDDYSKLLGFRAILFPQFDADQESAAQSIIPLIADDVRAGTINTLLDVGCGTGEILHFAGEYLSKGGRHVRRVGIDASAGELARAHDRYAGCEFVCCTAETVCELDQLISPPLDWKHTAILCVGHTLPHFSGLPLFLGYLKERRPPLLFVDFYHTWDETIEMLHRQPHEARYEMKMLGEDDEIFVLVTALMPERDRVSRGIRTMKLDGGPAIFQTRFQTVQAFQSSSGLLKALENAGYIRERDLRYRAGYGRMQGTLMSSVEIDSYRHICPTTRVLNEAYYHAVANLAKLVLAKDPIISAMKVFGTRAAVAVLPFDSEETFARYVSLVEGVSAPARLMHVQRAGHGFASVPTAHGLYMALLAQVSSSTVVPLPKLDDAGGVSDIDEAFAKVESQFFESSRPPEEAVPSGHSYFVVPFYFATLPLFCAVLNFTDALPSSTTDQEVYISVLRNFARLVSQEVQLAFERDLLRLFIDSALAELELTLKLTGDAGLKEIAAALNRCCQKPWKSWLLTIPSRPIAELSIVQREGVVLSQMLERAQSHALADVVDRIANWLHAGAFFDPEGADEDPHVKPMPIHKKRLAEMLQRAQCRTLEDLKKCNEFGSPKNTTHIIEWLARQLEAICERQDSEAFRKVKRVFRRNNTNTAFRFSSDRLMALCEVYVPDRVKAVISREPNPVVIADDPIPRIIRVVRELGRGFGDLIEEISLKKQLISHSLDQEIQEYRLCVRMKQQYAPARAIGINGGDLDEALRAACGRVVDTPFDSMELTFVVEAGLQETKNAKGDTQVAWVSAMIQKAEGGSPVKVIFA